MSNPPQARAGACGAVLSDRSALILCGWSFKDGATAFLNDIHSFDTETMRWVGVDTKGTGPSGRAYASSVNVSSAGRRHVVLYGGLESALAPGYLSDMYVLALDSMTWAKIPREQPWPVGRCQHSLCTYGGNLYLFGGCNKRSGIRHHLQDVAVFDLGALRWATPELEHTGQSMPPRRSGHVSAMVDGGLFIFGGGSGVKADEMHLHDVVWVLDTSSWMWRQLSVGADVYAHLLRRIGHSCVVRGTQVFIFGGLAANGNETSYMNDLLTFRADSWRKRVKTGSEGQGVSKWVWQSISRSRVGGSKKHRKFKPGDPTQDKLSALLGIDFPSSQTTHADSQGSQSPKSPRKTRVALKKTTAVLRELPDEDVESVLKELALSRGLVLSQKPSPKSRSQWSPRKMEERPQESEDLLEHKYGRLAPDIVAMRRAEMERETTQHQKRQISMRREASVNQKAIAVEEAAFNKRLEEDIQDMKRETAMRLKSAAAPERAPHPPETPKRNTESSGTGSSAAIRRAALMKQRDFLMRAKGSPEKSRSGRTGINALMSDGE